MSASTVPCSGMRLSVVLTIFSVCFSQSSCNTNQSSDGGGNDVASGNTAKLLDSTYAVVAVWQAGPDTAAFPFGTAFAIRPRLLATNAHVVEAIAELTSQVGVQMTEVVGVQHGTGTVVRLLRSFTHPDYAGTRSPDLGLFTTQEEMPTTLDISPIDPVLIGTEIRLAGFPGDVSTQVEQIIPGVNIPQATLTTAPISAFRAFDPTRGVTATDWDYVQYQVSSFPGASGSPVVVGGHLIAVHNAGTVGFVVSGFDEAGNPQLDRAPLSETSFGIHARYLRDLESLFDDNVLQGQALPPPYAPPPPPPCDPECAWCHIGTDNEAHCLSEWNGDGECDCGCQFDDVDCSEGTSPPVVDNWIVFEDNASGTVCDLANGADFEAIFLSPSGEMLIVTGEDARTVLFVDDDSNLIIDGTAVGFVAFATDGDGLRSLWLFELNGAVVSLDPNSAGLSPLDFINVPCDACFLIDNPPSDICP